MKYLYGILKAGNYWFATYHTYYKEKLRIMESTYKPYFFYRFGPLKIVEIQTNDILILIDNNFASIEASIEKKVVKDAKMMTKD